MIRQIRQRPGHEANEGSTHCRVATLSLIGEVGQDRIHLIVRCLTNNFYFSEIQVLLEH